MGEEVIEQTHERSDTIELKMNAKGEYYWSIKVHFDRAIDKADDVIADIERIDRKMREKFGGR